jgi:uncharacterized protein YciI
MDFLVYCRAIPADAVAEETAAGPSLTERHWSYMDGFTDRFTARGPTLGPDRDTWTGSLHIVDLPDAKAARAFIVDEPYYRAGRFASHVVRGFHNLLGRTMWEFPAPTDDPKFLVLALQPPTDRAPVAVDELAPKWRDVLVVYGELSTVEGEPDGVAVAVQVESRDQLDTLLAEPGAGLAGHRQLEVHDWEFGGRR